MIEYEFLHIPWIQSISSYYVYIPKILQDLLKYSSYVYCFEFMILGLGDFTDSLAI